MVYIVFTTFCKFDFVSKMKAAQVIVIVVQMSLNENMNMKLSAPLSENKMVRLSLTRLGDCCG